MKYSNCCHYPMSQWDIDNQRCPCCKEYCAIAEELPLDIEPSDEELDEIELLGNKNNY